jgi:trimeric autotransporter adhesin
MKKNEWKNCAIHAFGFLIVISTTLIAQNIEAKLPGNTPGDAFVVKDNSNNILFSIFGNGKAAFGAPTASSTKVSIVASAGDTPLGVTGSVADAVIVGTNKSTAASVGVKGKGQTGILGDGVKEGVKGEGSIGVYGLGSSTGVKGEGTTGVSGFSPNGYGVKGETVHASTAGIFGKNTSNSGDAIGVKGESQSPVGIGIDGTCDDGTGVQGTGSVGVYGNSTNATNGRGVYGAGRWGVAGYCSTTLGVGVRGEGPIGVGAYTNTGYAIWATAAGASGKAGMFLGAVVVEGKVGIKTQSPSYDLHVNGSAGKPGGGSWSNASDIRLKNVDGEYTSGLTEILKLRPIRFHYKPDNPRELPSDEPEIGFVAQEVRKVFPEAVSEGDDGYLDMNMHAINVSLVNAVKELHDIIRKQNERIDKLESALAERNPATANEKYSQSVQTR